MERRQEAAAREGGDTLRRLLNVSGGANRGAARAHTARPRLIIEVGTTMS